MTVGRAIERNVLVKMFKKASPWSKIFYVALLVLGLMIMTNYARKQQGLVEGFEETSEFIAKKGPEIFDDFYVNIYDDLLFSRLKNDFEIGTIVNKTSPTDASLILDIGSGTGHHVGALNAKGFKTIGVDASPAMVAKAKANYPNMDFRVADVMKTITFPSGSFTHITCLYFTLYYIQDKQLFFRNCMRWLMPGGYLIIHLVDKERFDPIIPAGDPFTIVSPQSYATDRITSTRVKFDQFDYKSNFEIYPNDITAVLHETFKYPQQGKIRKHEHQLFMPSQKAILNMAKNVGFILHSQVDMVRCQYAHQYMYVLQKPN